MTRVTSSIFNRKYIRVLANLSKLPYQQYRIMRLLLAPHEMSYERICHVLCNLPEGKRLSQEQVDAALYELVAGGYLDSLIEDGVVNYATRIDAKGNPIKDLQENIWNDFNFALDKLDFDEV